MSYLRGFLPPGAATAWPDQPFAAPEGDLPPRGSPPFGNLERATEIVWRRLDARLDDPIAVEHTLARTRIWVLDVFYYEVDRELRQLRAGIVGPEGELEGRPFILSPALGLALALRSLAPRVFRNCPREEMVAAFAPNGLDKAQWAVMRRVWQRLEQDRRFALLAHSILPHELALDPSLLRLTQSACKWFDEVRAQDYQAVWQNTSAFRKVQCENPRFLPMLLLYLESHGDRLNAEPVAQLKRWFKRQGLSEAAWRYLTSTSAAHWHPVWRRVMERYRLLATVKFLRVMEKAGFPPDPKRAVTDAWLNALGDEEDEWLSMRANWLAVDPAILGLAYGAAGDIAWGVDPLDGDARAIFRWAKAQRVTLDKNQVRAGWRSLVARWRQASDKAHDDRVPLQLAWNAATAPMERGPLRAEPLLSGAALRAEGQAMRNCLHQREFALACHEGLSHIYAISDKATGERVAVAAFEKLAAGGWRISQVKGPGNALAPLGAWRLAEQVLAALAQPHGGGT